MPVIVNDLPVLFAAAKSKTSRLDPLFLLPTLGRYAG